MYIFKVAYDGRYSFQQQPHKETVCDKILDTFEDLNLLKTKKIVYSGGRTDKGVSALGNFVVLDINNEIEINENTIKYINYKLNNFGIWILGYKEIEEIPKVEYRHYRYILPKIGQDIELMKVGAKKLVGTKSFHNFCKKDKSKEKSPIRTIYKIDIKENEFFITIDIIGESFLWQMVRKIVSALNLVSLKEKPISWIDNLLSNNYKESPPPAVPEGLILIEAKVDVDYNYSEYILKKFKNYWFNNYFLNVIKTGLSRSILEMCPGGAKGTPRAGVLVPRGFPGLKK
ncbi:tRNA pseudouridine(38-40) synthase TruA [Methanocaldococcus indicus]|uniref:tRNA pseudouridine(38-40) synthase TruA n=1 Tax=Methanocaldococcus indicus TaxID=213231 RepID=UPI003C6D1A3C